ncbi:4-hydroxybenzoate octaprenyltransferase [Taylorella asinigenitalis]|uniref:4-hydroxybenzoate octaprenyltransferase n=1 Tax=Taylorella asinigenitalis (strain MCE3) TaxID=1008459 RepID=G4QD20_TAYAM|nr:4-hydroxybenzoate octaprenyltransferase [Taylorella asinigenitalis]AEP35837.1 4-hydroxybenzoate polyprenyltransferase [Taylorella asinigenitalis MCE3]
MDGTSNNNFKNTDLSDIFIDDWVSKYLPKSWVPYARLARIDRPAGTWFAVITTYMALVQATHGLPSLKNTLIFIVGTFLLRSAGCTINDIWDRNFDKHVERTRFRPLTSGQISLKQAVLFFIAQMLIACLLLIFLNKFSILLAFALVPLVIIYPLGKRFTFWPQIILGISFNWGMLMAWSEVTNSLPLGAFLMYLGVVSWHLAYDTFYAYCDIEFDAKLGLKSTARLFGDKGKIWISGFFIFSIFSWTLAGYLLYMNWAYFVIIFVVAAMLYGQIQRFKIDDASGNFQLFKDNIFVNVLLLLAICLGVMVDFATI